MPERNHARGLVGQVLRSITPLTGGLAGGLGVAAPILAATYYEMNFGRPSSTAGLAIPFALSGAGLPRVLEPPSEQGFSRWWLEHAGRGRWTGAQRQSC